MVKHDIIYDLIDSDEKLALNKKCMTGDSNPQPSD